MDLAAILSALAGVAAGVLATAIVVRTRILPPLRQMSELTENTWDDDILDAVDESFLAVERHLGGLLPRERVEEARKETLEILGLPEAEEETEDR